MPQTQPDAGACAASADWDVVRFLAAKRHGGRWSAAELKAWSTAIADGSAADCQIGAFAMAAAQVGMDSAETVAWTQAIRDSGTVMRWPELQALGPVLDKHSSGGVGDCVSLLLAPMLAACGAYVPMISGRSLGHTGGTLDKLCALPGYCCDVGEERLRRVVAKCGMAIVGASAELAPTDRRLYAVRDVTATVDVVPLIVASILGKKLAVGADALVLDVKRGRGATLPDPAQARLLAQTLLTVANRAGLRSAALLTDMDEPLAPVIGNALELDLSLDYLRGETRPPRLHQVILALGAELLLMAGMAGDREEAAAELMQALDSGAAAERFAESIAALGGPPDVYAWRRSKRPVAPLQRDYNAPTQGHVRLLDARQLGDISVDLGAGRRHPNQSVDAQVGLCLAVVQGDPVVQGQPLCTVHARHEADAERALARLTQAIAIGPLDTEAPQLIERISC